MRKILLTLLLTISSVFGVAHAQAAVAPNAALLTWVAPIANTDGSVLASNQIASFKVYYGTTSGTYSSFVSVPGSSLTTTVTGLANGTWYFVVTAVSTSGTESTYSNQVSKVINVVPVPNPPTGLTVQ